MSTLPTSPLPVSIDEYLAAERTAVVRHEYRDGEVLAMSGGSERHALIQLNLLSEIRAALKGSPCRAYPADLRIRVPRLRRLTYPDGSIICGPPEFDPADPRQETVTNPRVIIEVLSPATEAYDRGEKFEMYRMIDTLEEYVLVSQAAPKVETFARNPQGLWRFDGSSGLDATVRIASVGVAVALREIYAGVAFSPAEAAG